MKSNLAIIALLTLSAAACQQNNSEVEQKRQQLESKRQELKDKKEIAALSQEMKTVEAEIQQVDDNAMPAPNFEAAYINGQNVTMRASNSAQSAKIGTFEQYESVTVLQAANAQNTNEVVLKEAVSLTAASGEQVPVPAGRAVRLGKFREGTESAADAYEVTFKHASKGALSGQVPANLLDLDNLWYQVERANGKRCWVFGKFVEERATEGECGL
jgi:hypothetical protein